MMLIETKNCHFCGESIRGRSDKRFCDDQCRTNFNNRLKSDSPLVKNINHILKKNRTILDKIVPQETGKVRATIKKLTDQGFNFSYYTHIYTTRQGTSYYFIYEYGYLRLENEQLMIVKRKEE